MAAILLVTGRATRPDEAIAMAMATIENVAAAFAENEGAQAAEDVIASLKG